MQQVSNADTAARLDLMQRRGDTFNATFEFKQFNVDTEEEAPEDLTGSTFKMKVIARGDAYKRPILEFADGEFTRTDPGIIETTKSAATMQIPAGYYAYDLQQTRPDGSVRTRLAGEFIITNDITP